MAVENISGIRTYADTISNSSSSANNGVSQTDFLRLMTTQLQNQDPFNPVDGQEMIVQMAQISNSTGIAEMNVTLKQISDQLAEHSALLDALKPDAATPDKAGGADTTDPETNIPA